MQTADHQQQPRSFACGFAAGVNVYNEAAFRFLLEIDRNRAERSGRPLLLVLVTARNRTRAGRAAGEPPWATELFAALAHGVRDTDFVGWYEAHRVAGAVLARAASSGTELAAHVRERVASAIAGRLTPAVARSLRVRVCQIRSAPKRAH